MHRRTFIKTLGVAAVGLYLGTSQLEARALTREQELLLKYAPYRFELIGSGVPLERLEAELRFAGQSHVQPATVKIIGGDPTAERPTIVATLYPAGPCKVTGWKLFQRNGTEIALGDVAAISLYTGDTLTVTYVVQTNALRLQTS